MKYSRPAFGLFIALLPDNLQMRREKTRIEGL